MVNIEKEEEKKIDNEESNDKSCHVSRSFSSPSWHLEFNGMGMGLTLS